jgi:hypothetical protein
MWVTMVQGVPMGTVLQVVLMGKMGIMQKETTTISPQKNTLGPPIE